MRDDLKYALDVPGTTILLDEAAEAAGNDNFTLVPTPSKSLDDPLNWSQPRKWLQLACIVLYVLATCFVAGCLYAIYGPLSDATGLSLAQINTGVGYVYLVEGISACIVLPLTICIGKRPVYIFSALLTIVFPFALSAVRTNSAWIGLCIVNGIAISPLFVAPEASLSSVFFYHEGALPFGIYVATTYGGAVLAPVFSGYIYTSLGWHGPPYMAGGFAVIVAVLLFFFLEETNFKHAKSPAEITYHDHIVEINPSAILEKMNDKGETVVEVNEENEKDKGANGAAEHSTPTAVHVHDRVISPYPGPRPLRKFPISKYTGGILLRGIVQPILMWRLPIILWSGLIFGIYQIFFNCMAALCSAVLSAPPYNLAPNSVGLTFLSPFLAIVPGAICGGYICDRWTVYCARKNGGVSEPEHKLWLMVVPAVLTPIGLLMMGLGVYYEAHWMVFVAGEFILTVAGPLATLISIAYPFDVFHNIHPEEKEGPRAEVQQAAPYLLSLILFAMCMTFGFNYAITPWAFDWGFKNFAISSACIGTAINCSAFPMIYFGKRLRRSGAAYYQKVINW